MRGVGARIRYGGIALLVVLTAGGLIWWRVGAAPPLPSPPPLNPDVTDTLVVEAIEKATAAVRKAPRSGPAWGELGMVLAAHGCLSEAQTCFQAAHRLEPNAPRWLYYQAVYAQEGDPLQQLAALQQAVTLGNDEAMRVRLADTLLAQGRLEEAEAQWRQLLQKEPRHPAAHLGLARLAQRRGDLADAQAHLSSADFNPWFRNAARVLRSQILEQQGDTKAAAAELARVEPGEDPGWPDPWVAKVREQQTGLRLLLARGDRQLTRGKPAEALPFLTEAARVYPRSDTAWLLLGRAYLLQKDWGEAERALRQAAELAPQSGPVQFQLGVVLYLKKDYRGAAERFRAATELKPDFAQAYYNLAVTEVDLKESQAARAAFLAALRYKPDYTDAHVAFAELLLEEGSRTEAAEHLRQAQRLSPDDPHIRELLTKAETKTR